LMACENDDSNHFKATGDPSTRQILDEQQLMTSWRDTTIVLRLNPTDMPWEAKVVSGGNDEDNGSWCKINTTNDETGSTVTVDAEANQEMSPRKAVVELTNGNRQYWFTIHQQYMPQMRPKRTYIQVEADSTFAYVFVETNVKPTITIPASASWLRIESMEVDTRAINHNVPMVVYRFNLDRNTGLGRAAEVTLTAESARPINIVIHQNPQALRSEEHIHVAEPGTLGTLLGGNALTWANINTLHLSGQLNDADMQTLRALLSPSVRYTVMDSEGNYSIAIDASLNLQHLDMARCQLVTGDNGLSIPTIDAHLESYSNSGHNQLGDGAFKVTRTKLESIVLPEKLESIGGWAFYYCEYLKTIDIPATVRNIGAYAFANCLSLSQINIPADSQLETLGSYAISTEKRLSEIYYPASLQFDEFKSFMGNFTAENIHVGWSVPPVLTRMKINAKSTLYVPKGSGDAYRQAKGWKEAAGIVEE
jgi:hypothetical protein